MSRKTFDDPLSIEIDAALERKDDTDRVSRVNTTPKLGSRFVTPSLLETPIRRKSSALSLSSLVSATPPLRTRRSKNEAELAVKRSTTPTQQVQARPADAYRDIERELQAVEERLSLYRKTREEEADEIRRSSQSNGTPSSPIASTLPPPAQQAGEVADEVENALANCDRLLSQAKLQASTSSLSRSFSTPKITSRPGTANGARTPHSNGLGSRQHHRQSLASPIGFSLPSEEQVLEITATEMRALASVAQQDMEQEAQTIREQQQAILDAQLQDLQRKYESKKKMVLLSLRETCEQETKDIIQQTRIKYEQDQQAQVKAVEQKAIDERNQILLKLRSQYEQETEKRLASLQVQLQSETLTCKHELEKQFATELEERLQQVHTQHENDLTAFTEKKRIAMERELILRREQAATATLKAQEISTKELKQQLTQQHQTYEHEEMEKLRKALAFGTQAQLQQLRTELETKHAQQMQDIEQEAKQTLEAKILDLKHVLTLSHKHELESLQRDLEKQHRMHVMEVHEQLENTQRIRVSELRTSVEKQHENAITTLQQEWHEKQTKQLEQLKQMMERDLTLQLHSLEMKQQEACEREVEQLRQRLNESNQREIESKQARLDQGKRVLLEEAAAMLTIDHDSTESQPQTQALVTQLEPLLDAVSSTKKNEIQRHILRFVRDFEDLMEEQRILMNKISETTGSYLLYKRECTRLEQEGQEMREQVHQLQTTLQSKEEIMRKLYMANEALLQRLGLNIEGK